MKEVIVGLVGYHASGKGTVADTLEEQFGFYKTSLSDRIREEARKRGESLERESLRVIGNDLREKEGPDVLVKRTMEIVEAGGYKRVVIDSVRNPAEVKAIKELGGEIVAVLASLEMRLKWIQERGRMGDATNMEELKESDWLENQSDGGDHVQNIDECIKMADLHINNNGAKEELIQKTKVELAPKLDLNPS